MAALFPDQPEAIREHPPDRRDDRPRRCRWASSASRTSRCRTARPSRRWLREECQRGLERRYGDGHPGAPGAPRLRARRDHLDGLRRLLPDRRRLHRASPASRGSRRPAAGQRAGLDRDLHAGHHAGRPDPLPAAVRALPQPRPGDDARHRRRLRGRPARRGHRLRQPQVRPGPRRPDHHLRHDARPGGDPRRRPRPGPFATARSTGSPRPSRTSSASGSTRRSRSRPSSASMVDARPGGQADHRLRPPARGRRPQRLDPRRRRRHQPRAADRAHAAPEGDQLRRADDPVRDARDRGARPAQVRLPRACRT